MVFENLPNTMFIKEIISYIRIFIDLMKKFLCPHKYDKPNLASIKKALIFFSASFTLAAGVFFIFGYYKLIDAFDVNNIKLILLLSSLVMTIGISLIMLISSYFIDKNRKKIDIVLATFVQVLYIYGLLIPLLAVFLMFMLEQSLVGLGSQGFLFVFCIILWVLIWWYGLVTYLSDFYKLKINSSIKANLLSIGSIFLVWFVGTFISFGQLSTNILNTDKATIILVNILLEREKINQIQADYIIAEYKRRKYEL